MALGGSLNKGIGIGIGPGGGGASGPPPTFETMIFDIDTTNTTSQGSGNNQIRLPFQPNAYSFGSCLLYTSPSPRDKRQSRMPSSA